MCLKHHPHQQGAPNSTLNSNRTLNYRIRLTRRMAPQVAADIRAEVDSLIKLGIMRKSKSSVASPCVPVRKPDGSYRLCVDYRLLNAATVPILIRYPTPSREATLQLLRGHKYYFTLDLWKGFHQFPCSESTIPLTTVNLPWGLYEYTRMPFGPTNGTAVFQQGIDTTFDDYLNEIITIFVDDICGFSDTAEQHVDNLRKIFQRCRDTGLRLKRSKCDLALKCVDFLGYVAGLAHQATPWPQSADRAYAIFSHSPKNVSEVRSFIGLANTFRDFIPQLSVIAKPLTGLCSKGTTFKWTPLCQQAFETIKQLADQAPVLHFPDPAQQLLIQTDASTQGIGAVLLQVND